jgi:hypothetical protein
VASVRQLFDSIEAKGAVGGFIVASGGFTADEKKFAEG